MNVTKRISVFLILVAIIGNVYSQNLNSTSLLFYLQNFLLKDAPQNLSNDTTIYVHIDNSVIDGLVGTDNIRVDILAKDCSANYIITNNKGILTKK